MLLGIWSLRCYWEKWKQHMRTLLNVAWVLKVVEEVNWEGSVILSPPLKRLWCYCSILSWKKILSKLKETKRRERETAKIVLGNLSPYLAGTSASLFLSLTSLTFNRRSQFAGRETPRWQEMKPPQHLNTRLAHSTVLLLYSSPSFILLSAISQHMKGLE